MKIILNIIKWLIILFFTISVISVLVLRWCPVYVTPLMLIRAVHPVGTEQQKIHERNWAHHWVGYNEISSWMPKAVIATEDGHFYDHNGFDFKAIEKALEEKQQGKRERGASTISQQTAKNVFLWPSHSWIRKGLETYFTILIEFFWSKERIMEVYLNSIEMGAGIYGVEAAARFYFNTSAAKLTKRESALIALCLPSPLKRDPANPSKYMNRRLTTILRYM